MRLAGARTAASLLSAIAVGLWLVPSAASTQAQASARVHLRNQDPRKLPAPSAQPTGAASAAPLAATKPAGANTLPSSASSPVNAAKATPSGTSQLPVRTRSSSARAIPRQQAGSSRVRRGAARAGSRLLAARDSGRSARAVKPSNTTRDAQVSTALEAASPSLSLSRSTRRRSGSGRGSHGTGADASRGRRRVAGGAGSSGTPPAAPTARQPAAPAGIAVAAEGLTASPFRAASEASPTPQLAAIHAQRSTASASPRGHARQAATPTGPSAAAAGSPAPATSPALPVS